MRSWYMQRNTNDRIFEAALDVVRYNCVSEFNRYYSERLLTPAQLQDCLVTAVINNSGKIVRFLIPKIKINDETVSRCLSTGVVYPNSKTQLEFFLSAGHIPSIYSNFVPTEILHLLNAHISQYEILSYPSTKYLIMSYIQDAIPAVNSDTNNVKTINMLKSILQLPGPYQGQYAQKILRLADAEALNKIDVSVIKAIISKDASCVDSIRKLASEEEDTELAEIYYRCAYTKEDLNKMKAAYETIKNNIFTEIDDNAINPGKFAKFFHTFFHTEDAKITKVFQRLSQLCEMIEKRKIDFFTKLELILSALLLACTQNRKKRGVTNPIMKMLDDLYEGPKHLFDYETTSSRVHYSVWNNSYEAKLSPELEHFKILDQLYAKEQRKEDEAEARILKMG
jgi:hypothetical protein